MKLQRIIWLVLVAWVMLGVAHAAKVKQDDKFPYWVKHLPQSRKGNFYYRVTMAEGADYEKAYAKAFAMAILESSWKHGVAVGKKDDLAAIESDIVGNINIMPNEVKVPLNKVCEYIVPKPGTMTGVKIYVLWQVGNTSADSQFEIFTNCE